MQTREQARGWDDRPYHEAVGWAVSMLDGRQLADAARRARRSGCPEVAEHLLRWADQKTDALFVRWADGDRERASVRDLLIDLMPDDA